MFKIQKNVKEVYFFTTMTLLEFAEGLLDHGKNYNKLFRPTVKSYFCNI